MDVQGSQYHLLNGEADWSRCTDSAYDQTLGSLWAQDADPSRLPSALQFDADPVTHLEVLRLRRETPLFRRAGRTLPLLECGRRGAGRDSYGNWYWIDEDQVTIRWRPTDDTTSSAWWHVADQARDCAGSAGGPGFASCAPAPHVGMTLQGLTVTRRHLLLAGYLRPASADGPATSGLLVFDLQAGGEPLLMPWPVPFDPWDLADLPDGGALVLDQTGCTYWHLDEHLRVRGRQDLVPTLFQAADQAPGGPPEALTGPVEPIGTPLTSPSLRSPIHPVSIEPGPDGGVLILDSDPIRGYSLVHLFDGDQLVWSVSLADSVEVVDPADPSGTVRRYSLLGYDFAYAAGPLGSDSRFLYYVVDSEGKQVVAYDLAVVGSGPGAEYTVVARPDFLPLRRWDGKALVRSGTDIWYDFGDRWIPVEVFSECRFARTATLATSTAFTDLLAAGPSGEGTVPTPAGSPFDSQLPGCVWHRLLLDAEIPGGTSIAVRARANDDPDLLLQTQWVPQPAPYQRSDGAELPWYDPWADQRDPVTRALPDRTGCFELLFQQVIGRYVQIELTLTGNSRSSPLLRSLRAWYPRFSYEDHYLPAIYAASDSADRFFDRFLANFEGFYTALEERIEHSHMILDARTTLADDLPWLAAWFGLVLDPQWDEAQRRFLIRNVDRYYRLRGTLPGLVSTLRVYLGYPLDESVFEVRAAQVGGVRVIERFLTRDAGGADDQYGRVRGSAHRFDVLVPVDAAADTLAMVARIVESAKPAHTAYTLKRYYDMFVVGQARLGIDTELGTAPAFVPMVTGEDLLAAGYLGYPRPFDVADRVVSDRDRLGDLPAL